MITRGNARAEVFHKPEDYAAFFKLMHDANERLPMRRLAWCVMPNHFHLVLWPHKDGDLSTWMQWLLTAARPPLPSPLSWQRTRLAGAFQGFSDRGRRALVDGLAVCGAQRAAGQLGAARGVVGMVFGGGAGRGAMLRCSTPVPCRGVRIGWSGSTVRRAMRSWRRCENVSSGARLMAARRGSTRRHRSWDWKRAFVRAGDRRTRKSRMSPFCFTGKFTTAKCRVMQIRVSGEAEPLEPTPPHRFFSLDRSDYIPAHELRVGEKLRTRNGRSIAVESIGMKPGLHRVFNFEVEGDHNFFVGECGVLVHNAYEGEGLLPKGTDEGDQLRYDRYTAGKAAAGEEALSFDDWFVVSRGGRNGGPIHDALQKEMSSRPGFDSEVRFGDTWADAAGPDEIHQIGDLNVRGDPIARARCNQRDRRVNRLSKRGYLLLGQG